MSIQVLDGSEEPNRHGSLEGFGDFIAYRPPSLDESRPRVTAEMLSRTIPASQAMVYLARSLAE